MVSTTTEPCIHCGVSPRKCTPDTFAQCALFRRIPTYRAQITPQNFQKLLDAEPRIDATVIQNYAAAYPSRFPNLLRYLIRSFIEPLPNVVHTDAIRVIQAATAVSLKIGPDNTMELHVSAGDAQTAQELLAVLKPQLEASIQEVAQRFLRDRDNVFAETLKHDERTERERSEKQREAEKQRTEALQALNTDMLNVAKLWHNMMQDPDRASVSIVRAAVAHNISRAAQLGLNPTDQFGKILTELNGYEERAKTAAAHRPAYHLEMLRIAKMAVERIIPFMSIPEASLMHFTVMAIQEEIEKCPSVSPQDLAQPDQTLPSQASPT